MLGAATTTTPCYQPTVAPGGGSDIEDHCVLCDILWPSAASLLAVKLFMFTERLIEGVQIL